MKKKLIAALTSAAMVATMVPATAFAASPSTAKSEQPAAVVAAEEESAAVTAFRTAVDAIPVSGENYGYTDAYKSALDAAETAYKSLNASEVEALDGDEDLTAYNNAKASYESWVSAVDDVNEAIGELPTKLGIFADASAGVSEYEAFYNGDTLKELVKKYNELDQNGVNGQKAHVSDVNILHAFADNKNGVLITPSKASSFTSYSPLYKAIKAINEQAEITGANYNTSAFTNVKAAFEALTEDQREVLAQDVLSKYQKGENTAKKAEKLMEAYTTAEKDLSDKYASGAAVTTENVSDADALCKTAENAYEALDTISGLQAKATAYDTKVKAIRDAIKKIQDSSEATAEAQPVLDRIANLPKASAITDMSSYDEINSIFEAYKQLSSEAKKIVDDDALANDFNNVASAVAKVYNAMSAEDQAARAKEALALLPSDDYKVNQKAQTEFEMATTRTDGVSVPVIGKATNKPKSYTGKASATTVYFTQNEIDKAEGIADDLKAAYQAEVDAIKELIKDLDATEIPSMDASAFATAKAKIDQAEAAVESLSPEATNVYTTTETATKDAVDKLIAARDTYLGKAAADGLKARMEQLPVAANITAENLATYKPVVEALRADYDAFEGDVENEVYGTYTNPFGSGDYATALDYLEAAEAQIAALELGQDAAKVDEAIEALTILDADKTYTAEELLAAQAANAAAREAYENLSADEAGEVTKYAKLVEAEKAVVAASQKTIDTEAEKIGNVGLTLTDAQIQQYKVVYDLLSALGKDTSAITGPGQGYYKAAIAKLNVMYPNATKVSDQLSDLNENSSAADILAAREAYDALSDIEKTLVSQEALDNLLDVEKNGKNSDKLLSKATVAAIADQEYTGDQIRPTLTVTSADKKTLKEGTDYTVTYNNNVLVGTATVTITGTGDYAGTITAAFDIVGISINDATVTVANQQTYTGSALTPAVTVKVDGKELTTADYDVAYSNNTNVGTATVTITGKGNYAGTATAKFEIVKANIQKASVTGVANRYYTGKARTQTDLRVYIAGKVLSTDNYSVVYKNNTNIGQASLTITGKGNYTGTITKTFIVKPRKVASVKVTKGKKRVTVRYKKQNGARYQIYYKKAGTKAKTVKTAAVKRTIKKLKSGKTYTIKVRAYKKIGSKTYYGKYSKAKKVRVR